MFKKIALVSMVALSSQLQVIAAGCDVPVNNFDWVHAGGRNGDVDFCPPNDNYNNANCIVQWNGFGWWSNYHATADHYFYESKQSYNPLNVTVDNNRLKFTIRKFDMGGPLGANEWTAAEAVLVSQGGNVQNDGTAVNIGYGDYLFTVENPEPFSKFDRALVFGGFTYMRDSDGTANAHKELDMVEISQWGYTGNGACPWNNSEYMSRFACHGSFQMGSQPWGEKGALQRFPMKEGDPDILDQTKVTYYMRWTPGAPVKYKTFKGAVDMRTAQTSEGNIANFEMAKTDFIPKPDACVRFHFNFYRAVYSEGKKNIDLEPKKAESVIYVTNFEYQPAAR